VNHVHGGLSGSTTNAGSYHEGVAASLGRGSIKILTFYGLFVLLGSKEFLGVPRLLLRRTNLGYHALIATRLGGGKSA